MNLSMNDFDVAWGTSNMRLPRLSSITICTWDIDPTTIPISKNLYIVDISAYFLIKIRGMQRDFEDVLDDIVVYGIWACVTP